MKGGRKKRGVYKGVENRGKEPVNEERRLLCDSLLFFLQFRASEHRADFISIQDYKNRVACSMFSLVLQASSPSERSNFVVYLNALLCQFCASPFYIGEA